MARKTVTRLADSAASIGYQNGWKDAHESLVPRMAELEDLLQQAIDLFEFDKECQNLSTDAGKWLRAAKETV